MLHLTWIGGLARRRPGRMAGAVVGVAMAVALLASLGTFFAASKTRMTEQAVAGVPVDWQVQLAAGSDPAATSRTVTGAPGVRVSLPVGYASTTGLSSSAGGTQQTTGPGMVLGLPDGYAAAFPGSIRPLVGATSGVLLAQQTAANLHAAPGSMVSIRRPGLPPASVRVQGVVDLPTADSLFQRVGASPKAALQAPPDNVVLLPAPTWHRLFDPIGGANPAAVRTQLHVRLDPALPTDPGAAFTQVVARANNLEAKLAGSGLIGDNLGARLDAARGDAIYAQLLFLFLGLPGAVLAALLTGILAGAGADRRRREQALLRIRGASPRRLVSLAAAEAGLVGLAGVALGLAGAELARRAVFKTAGLGASGAQSVVWAGTAAAVGLLVAGATILLPAWRDARGRTVAAARTSVERPRRPLWARLYLDLLLLAAAGLVFWQSAKSSYQVVLAPEGVPTISVSYVTFLAPLLLWAGAALLAWRLATGVLTRGRRPLAALSRPLAHGLAGVVAASMSRQRRLLATGLMVVALTGSFAVSTAIFNATYGAQARVDAQLTNGADVAAATPATGGLPPGAVAAVTRLPGVAAAEPMQHRFAYVGNDLQDLYGIDPATFGRAAPLSDAFFAGGSANATLGRLASRPDAVLVSAETVKDFQLQPGDLLRLRLQSGPDRAYRPVEFHYVGVAREFPTAPRDSFLVANAAYVARATGQPAAQTLLVRAAGSPQAVAASVRRALAGSGATVTDIDTALRTTLSSLTAVDLAGLTRLELGFAFLLAAAAAGLVFGLGLVERRRTFAIATALGARTRQLAAFVWTEAAFVVAGGVLLGTLTGWGLALVLVKLLTGVFDPPPERLLVPWPYLLTLAAVTLGAVAAAGSAALRSARRPAIEVLHDL